MSRKGERDEARFFGGLDRKQPPSFSGLGGHVGKNEEFIEQQGEAIKEKEEDGDN